MPFALVLIGLAMIITGAKDTHLELGKTLAGDFTGEGNFTYWAGAIGAIGAIGYAKPLQPISRLGLGLIIVVMLLSNQGIFARFLAAIKGGPEAIPRPSPATGSASNTTTNPADSILPGNTIFDWLGKAGKDLPNPWDWLGNPFGLGLKPQSYNSSGERAQANFAFVTERIVPFARSIFGIV